MSQLLRLPFQSYHHLRQWRDQKLSGESDQDQHVERFYQAMKYWFERMPATIRVYDYEADDRAYYADVQIEIRVGNQSTQVYLMTLITPAMAAFEKAGAADWGVEDMDWGTPLEEITDPFGTRNVLWDFERLGPDEVVAAVRAWSDKFWPDFECEYRYECIENAQDELLEGEFMDWREFESITDSKVSHCRVLLQCASSKIEKMRTWALGLGCKSVYVLQNNMVLLDGFPRESLSSIKSDWPDLEFVASSSIS